jgi:hypothetical protein
MAVQNKEASLRLVVEDANFYIIPGSVTKLTGRERDLYCNRRRLKQRGVELDESKCLEQAL